MTTIKSAETFTLPAPLQRIADASHHDPFEILGRHQDGTQALVRIYRPGVAKVTLPDQGFTLQRIGNSDFFEWQGLAANLPLHYRVCWQFDDGNTYTAHDPYSFPPLVGDLDMHLFAEGRHLHAYRVLGAHPTEYEGIAGVLFAVWAPNAGRVSVIGNHNGWDGRIHPMRNRGGAGIWELFIPGLEAGSLYKFELRSRSGDILVKGDPYGAQWQKRPHTAAVVAELPQHEWTDNDWLAQRQGHDWQHKPMSIYEVHLGSWRRGPDDFLNYRDLAVQLTDYVLEHGFTHVELLPITEHPLDASWGYQCTGFFAPTSRFGTPDDFRYFVDHLHRHGIGIILDWVPGHFPRDEHGLARFDGTALYEYEDPRKGEHRDWGTLIFNYGRHEVKSFLLASAVHWIEEFHLDGLRVDAVASMLYLDYSREAGDWEPNIHGGREHLEAVDFLRELNTVLHERFPGILMIAEESTAWPQVSRPVWLGGLGFGMKWNMGWMHDTLAYMSKDPIHRHYHHDLLTFGVLYNFTENFVLPFSHDEVVHGKGSMLGKMHGDEWQRFANLRLLYTFQWTYPGKKLLFMGCEFAQGREWNDAGQLEWDLLQYDNHQGVSYLIGDLNRLYRNESALHQLDFANEGFEWIDCHDSSQSTLSYLRLDAEGNHVAMILNFTPITRLDYRIGLPLAGEWEEVLCSDAAIYGGSNVGNGGLVVAEEQPWMNRPASASLVLPPLAAVVLRRRG